MGLDGIRGRRIMLGEEEGEAWVGWIIEGILLGEWVCLSVLSVLIHSGGLVFQILRSLTAMLMT